LEGKGEEGGGCRSDLTASQAEIWFQ